MKLSRFVVAACFAVALPLQAQQFNPDAYLGANPDVKAAGLTAWDHIAYLRKNNLQSELKARLAAATELNAIVNSAGDVKIMFCACDYLDENSTIQNTLLWAAGAPTGKTTIKEMVLQGWRVQSVNLLNKSQFWLTFVK